MSGVRCRRRVESGVREVKRAMSLLSADADGGEEAERDASARHLVEEKCAGGGEDEVGSPDAEEGRELAVLGEGDAYRARGSSRRRREGW